MSDPSNSRSGEIVVYADFHLLDRQVVDRDGTLVCKIDDLELLPESDGSLRVGDVLFGPAALGPRFGGRLGRWMVDVQHRLSDERSGPARFPSSSLESIDDVAHLSETVPVGTLEAWLRTHLIGRIPGAGDAGR